MSSLNWAHFDGTHFQKFCNSLLLFNVSKFAHVFSADGADGGVDQLFAGTYDSKKGLWRFQDKFHNSGTKSADISALKRDIVYDIKTNYKNENYIVFITNVNLTVAKYNELLKTSQELLKELNIKNCEFFLWHEASLEALVSNYPVIYNWFWEKESVLLQPHEVYFSNQLRDDIDDIRNQLKNKFFGRESQLAELSEFIQNPSQSALAIIANGGYGKTRLLIEFFKKDISDKEEWIPLVMSHIGFNPTQFAHLLKTKRKLLIFIDNAHEIPDIVSEVKRQIDNTHGKDKLVLTTRPTLFSEILSKLPSHSKEIGKLRLPKLPYDLTKEMFKSELSWLKDISIIHLATISKGVPNVILELIRVVRLGKQPNEISAEEAFNQSVKEIFSEAINDIEKKTQIPKEKIHDLLRLIALISPVNNNDTDKVFISEFIELRKDKLELMINELTALNLLDPGQTISIKPDPYSDSILAETITKNKTFIDLVRNYIGAEIYLENILKNLSEAEIADDEKEYFIDGLLYGYVSLLKDTSTPNKKIKNIYEFVAKITVSKPKYGVFVIREFIDFHNNIDHSIHTEIVGWSDKTYFQEIGELTSKILTSLSTYSKYGRDNKDEVHLLIEGYTRATGDLNILISCYGYHEWNFPYFGYLPRQCCESQLYLKSIICKDLQSSDDIEKLNIAIKSSEFLMELEFQLERYFEEATMQMHFGHAQIPYCDHIEEIRTDILKSLIIFHNRPSNETIKVQALSLLMDYFFYCCKNYSKRHKQDLSKEIPIALAFFNSLLDGNPTTYQKNKILNYIQRFGKAEYQEQYQETMESLKTKASISNSLYEALEMNLINEDYFDSRNNLEPRTLKLLEQYGSIKKFENDLINIRIALKKTSSNFQGVLAIISKYHPAEAKILFEHIKNDHPELIGEAVFLIKDQYKDVEYFYEVLQWLWDRKDVHVQSFFWLLGWGRNRDRVYYKASDLDYYEYIIDNNIGNHSTHDFIKYNLLDYAYLNKERTFELLDKFMKVAHQQYIDALGYVMFDKKEKYGADFKNEIKKLFFSNTDKIEIDDFHSQSFLRFLEEYFGFDELFNFIDRLIDEQLKKDEYRNFNFDRNFYLNDSLTIQDQIKRYIKILEWYINNYEINPRKQDYIINIFRPGFTLTVEIQAEIVPLMGKYQNDINSLITLAKGLRSFVHTNEEWVITISMIADLILKNGNQDLDLSTLYGSSFLNNSGGKSKSGKGVPYTEDKAKKELLEKVIAEATLHARVVDYLKKCLLKVNEDITREIADDEREFNW